MIRDIEMARARQAASADRVCCAADFEPKGGLSGDRDTALAQATAECLRRTGETSLTVDRTLPYLYAHFIPQAGIAIEYSEDLGVMERRVKSPAEIDHLRNAQKVTGEAIRLPDHCERHPGDSFAGAGWVELEGLILAAEHQHESHARPK